MLARTPRLKRLTGGLQCYPNFPSRPACFVSFIFNETTFQVVPDKTTFRSASKDITYTNVKTADASFAKKPMLSGGGAVATALLVGVIFALPFLFIKKKKHWITVQTEKEFVVMQLGDNNFRQIAAEFETHGVKVNDLGDESKK